MLPEFHWFVIVLLLVLFPIKSITVLLELKSAYAFDEPAITPLSWTKLPAASLQNFLLLGPPEISNTNSVNSGNQFSTKILLCGFCSCFTSFTGFIYFLHELSNLENILRTKIN